MRDEKYLDEKMMWKLIFGHKKCFSLTKRDFQFSAATAAQEAHLYLYVIICSCVVRTQIVYFHLHHLATFGNVWQRLATFGNAWQRLATFGNVWQRLAMPDNVCQCLAMLGNFWQFLAMFGNIWQLLTTFGNFAKL